MNTQILELLRAITPEEQEILSGTTTVNKEIYTSSKDFIIDSRKLLEKGKLIEIRPNTRFIHFPRHRHNYVEMVYMCSGTTTHIINDTQKVILTEGDLLLLNQNVTQEVLPASVNDIAVNFIILPEFFDQAMQMIGTDNVLYNFMVSSLSSDNGLSSYLHFQMENALPVQNLIENMIWTILRKTPASNTVNKVSMGLLFLNLLNFADTINAKNEDQYEQHLAFSALKYIETNYKSGTLEDFCDSVHLKPYMVSRLLKKHTGMNFKELLMERKLQQAAYLLKNTPLSTENIFHAVGYENSSFFHKKFKEKYGMTPKQFRKEGEVMPL